MKLFCSILMLVFAVCGKAQDTTEVKSIEEYPWNRSTDSFELKAKRFYDEEKQVIRTLKYSMFRGKTYVSNETSNYNGKREEKWLDPDGTVLSYRMKYDSLEYSIDVSYNSRGDSPTEEKRTYLRKEPKIESPYALPEVEMESPYLANALLSKYHYMLSESNKRWNDKGELVYSENWECTFYPNGAKHALKRYILNPTTWKKELREQVSFAPSGQLREHLHFQYGELQSYEYYSEDGLLTKSFRSMRPSRNSGIDQITEESFAKLNRKGKPVTVTSWRILEKHNSDGTIRRDTSTTLWHYTYDRKGQLLKEEKQAQNGTIKTMRTYQYYKNGDSSISTYSTSGPWAEKTHTYNAKKQLIKEEYFSNSGFLTSSVNRKYLNGKVIKVWGLTQYQFGDEVQSEKYTHQKKGDTSFYWSFIKNTGSTEYVFNKSSIHFNPYDYEIDSRRYFPLFEMSFFNHHYSKTIYHYNQNIYCDKTQYYTGTDTNQMLLSFYNQWTFAQKKIENPLIRIHHKSFRPTAFPPQHYFISDYSQRNVIYPTTSYTEKSLLNGTISLFKLGTYTSSDSSQEWKVLSHNWDLDTLVLSHHSVIKRIPFHTDSLPSHRSFKEFYMEYNTNGNSMDTLSFDIVYFDAANHEILRQYFSKTYLSKPRFYQTNSVYQTFNASGDLISKREYIRGQLWRSTKFEIDYLK